MFSNADPSPTQRELMACGCRAEDNDENCHPLHDDPPDDAALWTRESIAQYHADEQRASLDKRMDASRANMKDVAAEQVFLDKFVLAIKARHEPHPAPPPRRASGRQPNLKQALFARAATCEALRGALREDPRLTRAGIADRLFAVDPVKIGIESDFDDGSQVEKLLNRIAGSRGFHEYMDWVWLLTQSPALRNRRTFNLASLSGRRLEWLVRASMELKWLRADWKHSLCALESLEPGVSNEALVAALENATLTLEAPPATKNEGPKTKAARARLEKLYKTQAGVQVVDLGDAWRQVKYRLGLTSGFIVSATALRSVRSPDAIAQDRARVAAYRQRKELKRPSSNEAGAGRAENRLPASWPPPPAAAAAHTLR